MKLWNIAPGKPDFNPAAIEQMGLSQLVTQVLLSRGFETAEEVKQFFSTAPVLHDPFLLKDMDKAVGRIEKALLNEELIAVYGDYDCDGVTSTIVLCSYLESRGAQVLYYIPDRADEGYGLNANAVQALKDQGVGLVITVDNGISAVEEIALANQLGLDVVVTDHHTAPQVLPNAVAVVDPKQPGLPLPQQSPCGGRGGV